MAQATIIERFLAQAVDRPQGDALVYRNKGAVEWTHVSWSGYVSLVRQVARGFIAQGLKVGQSVAILSNNRHEWVVSHVAAMLAGAVPVGIYPTSTAEQAAYIIQHCGAPIVICENKEQMDKLKAQMMNMPAVESIIVLEGAGDNKSLLSWEQLLSRGEAFPSTPLDNRIADIDPTAVAGMIYTSGTTGPPKAVMLTHANTMATANMLMQAANVTLGEERVLNYLPLSHIAEQMASVYLPLYAGAAVWFAQSLQTIKDDLTACRPTLFFAVPRVWEKFAIALTQKMAEASPPQAWLISKAGDIAQAAHTLLDEGKPLPGALRLKYRLMNRLVYSRVKQGLGLDQVRYFVSGAAPLAGSTQRYFQRLDIGIREIYGQSEGTGVATLNLDGATRPGTVGRALPGVELKIAEDGEILVRGENVFKGYFKDPVTTAETLKDGWLHSGDVGVIDPDGFLRITDRKKDLIITAGGKNVAPQNIEGLLKGIPEISQAVVIGDRQKFLVALLTIQPDLGMKWVHDRQANVVSLRELANSEAFKNYVQAQIDALNEQLAKYETVKRFAILQAEFTEATGELTPSMKIKRRVVTEKYDAVIRKLYGEDWNEAAG